jgi:hypothetical protein
MSLVSASRVLYPALFHELEPFLDVPLNLGIADENWGVHWMTLPWYLQLDYPTPDK